MDELTRAKKRALYLLTDMDRTEKQLLDKLKKTGYSDEVIAKTMDYVKGFGYINDTRYAAHYIESLKQSRSKKRLCFDMNKKGLPQEVIEQAFEEAGDYDERPLIRKLLAKKAKSISSDDPKKKQKLAAFLARKGFSSRDIFSVLDEQDCFLDSTLKNEYD